MRLTTLALLGAAGLFTLVSTAHAVQDKKAGVAVVTAGAAAGGTAFMEYGCWQCHGTVGQGGGTAGPALPRAFPVEALRIKLRTQSGRMPVFSKRILSDADVDNIGAYIKSIPQDPPLDRIPLL